VECDVLVVGLVAGIRVEDGDEAFLWAGSTPGHPTEALRSSDLFIDGRIRAACRPQHGGQQRLLLGVRIGGRRGSGVGFGGAARCADA
jgi:hypothetical protein